MSVVRINGRTLNGGELQVLAVALEDYIEDANQGVQPGLAEVASILLNEIEGF